MKTLIIVPAFNEASVIKSVILGIKKALPNATILVVDDGSRDETKLTAETAGALVARHRINRGLGAAIGTGLQYALQENYDIAVTFDADGQHNERDLLKVIHPIESGKADVVVGSRMISSEGMMPWDRKIINNVANFLTFVFFGVQTTDSQSGFRAFSKKAIQGIRIQTQRMEVSSEIFGEIQRLRLRFKEVPITVIYTDYSRRKGQGNSNALSIFFRLVVRLFR